MEVIKKYPLYEKCFAKNISPTDCVFRTAPYLAPIFAELKNPQINELKWSDAVLLIQDTMLEILDLAGNIKL
jgi:hypothetical protein